MNPINRIAENIAFKLGDQFNTTLQESIKDTILNYRATALRDDMNANFLSDYHFSQTGTIKFEEVNLLKEFGADFSAITAICEDAFLQDKYTILKSTVDVPSPIRTKSSGNSLYNYIGSSNGKKKFVYTTLDKFYYYKSLSYSAHVIYYIVMNKRIYIINNLDECDINDSLGIANVLIKSVFEDPSDFYNSCNNIGNFADDEDFPISRDMLTHISNKILKGEYPLIPKDGQTVNIKPDDND